MSTTVHSCKHCGKPCVSLDDEDYAMLADGASALYAVHIACERRARRKPSVLAPRREPKVSLAEIEAAFERAKEEL